MAGKRKRNRASNLNKDDSTQSRKRTKLDDTDTLGKVSINHPTLCLYYPRVVTLKDYVVSRLPPSSVSRCEKIVSIAKAFQAPLEAHKITAEVEGQQFANSTSLLSEDECSIRFRERNLAKLLETTLVGICQDTPPELAALRQRDLLSFSQQLSLVTGSSSGGAWTTQSEIIDFAIWQLFHRIYRNVHKPLHLLCCGYQRASAPQQPDEEHGVLAHIYGIVSHYPNNHASTMKNEAWTDVFGLLGRKEDWIMRDLVLDCGVFVSVDGGSGNYYQLSGKPLTEMQPMSSKSNLPPVLPTNTLEAVRIRPEPKNKPQPCCSSPAAISFVRNRMFYARAALNAKGRVRFGPRHIHALNRYGDANNPNHTVHLMKYIFPRQFGLHNAFTSKVDSRETVQPFKDYTLREQEITQAERQKSLKRGGGPGLPTKPQLPKRLRGATYGLVKELQRRHAQCSYVELLKHYCPVRPNDFPRQRTLKEIQSNNTTQLDAMTSAETLGPTTAQSNSSTLALPRGQSLIDSATPASDVSAFCRAVLSNLIPDKLWGCGPGGLRNKGRVLCTVDQFVRLGRFENMSLHVVIQGLELTPLSWLTPPNLKASAKTAKSDMNKRKEIFLEFLYYVFDSLLIPLIRSNFHVTESNVHRNRLFFFRHDIWHRMTEPALSSLKLSMFEELDALKARKLLDARPLGFSQIRLLPKANGIRPIMNLRRRVTKLQNGKVVLGRSINSVMAPVFNLLDYEKRKQPGRIGSAIFSVGEMYPKLTAFRRKLESSGAGTKPFYFAKCDVQSCFDTIPQRRVVKLLEQVASEDEYRIARHAEIKPSENHSYGIRTLPKPVRKFVASARAYTDFARFEEVVEEHLAKGKKNTIFVDAVVQTSQKRDKMLDLLEEHVERNIIKIGKKFFKQKAGIPQGSVLSSLLCSYFYGALEREFFGFLDDDESILLRLTDDFLLITTNENHAKRFLQTMHDGIEEYGVRVNPAKSLVSSPTTINGVQIPQVAGTAAFPYCGNRINTGTLEITKDRDRRKGSNLADSLTVEPSKVPGKTFHRKALNAFKIQTHKMFLDTAFNSVNTVLATIYGNFVEAAMKYYRYTKGMPKGQQPHDSLLIDTIRDLTSLATTLIKSPAKSSTPETPYACSVSKRQIQWLANTAFTAVLGRKQTNYRHVLAWLKSELDTCAPRDGRERARLAKVVSKGGSMMVGCRW